MVTRAPPIEEIIISRALFHKLQGVLVGKYKEMSLAAELINAYKKSASQGIAPSPVDLSLLPYPHCIPSCHFIREGECRYQEMHTPTIAVDFDRVLFTHESWQGHYNVGEPIPGAREALIELQKMGFKIMIWTTRAQVDIISESCKKSGIPFDYINQNPNQPPEINPSKPVADYYIDDRAVTFLSWPSVLEEIKHREMHDPYYRTCLDNSDGVERILVHKRLVGKPGLRAIKRRELAYKDFEGDEEGFTSLGIPVEIDDMIYIYRRRKES
jgi:hypothetical protein